MKKIKRIITLALGVLLVMCVCTSLVACPPPEPPEPTPASTCRITIYDFDEMKGNVALNPQKDEYEVGEKVTLEITSNQGYEIKSVYFGDTVNLTSQLRGENTEFTTVSYVFYASVDRTIKVEFQQYGTWQDSKYDWSLNIEPYDATRGSISVRPDRSRFEDGEQVTINVIPTGDSLLRSFYVNGVDQTSSIHNDTYTLTITQDVTVRAVFDDDISYIRYPQSKAEFEKEISRQGKVFVDFTASWCGWCKSVTEPQLEQFIERVQQDPTSSEAQLNVKIVVFETELNNEMNKLFASYAGSYGNGGKSLPFMLLFENGKVVKNRLGAFDSDGRQNTWEDGYPNLLTWLA